MDALWQPHVLAGAVAALALGGGLLRERAGAWALRLLTLAVAGVLLAGVCNPGFVVEQVSPARLRVVANGPLPESMRAGLTARLGGALELVQGSPDAGELAVALRGAGGGDVAPARALLWLQPIASAEKAAAASVPAAAPMRAMLFTGVAPLEFEPQAVHVRLSSAPRVGRPLALELIGLPPSFAGELVITAQDGSEVAGGRFDGASGSVNARVEAVPATAGTLRVAVRANAGESTFTARGEFDVAPSPTLLAVGVATDSLAAALRAQGFTVESSLALPDDLARLHGVVIARVLTPDEQERVCAFVDGGGGVFLVGAPDGGALPIVGEPGAALSPVLLAARPQVTTPGEPGTGAQPTPTPAAPTTKPPPGPVPDKPASGDTSGAGPPSRDEREVERRVVAMVFVIDRSQSMLEPATPGGPTRMDYVRSSAQATASKLLPGDELAIVTFGNRDAEETVLPLTSVTAFELVHRAFAGLAARQHEGTYVDSALAQAALLLAQSRAAVKHVVVITDGLIEDLVVAIARAKRTRAAGASVSMIRFGAGNEGIDATKLCRTFTEFGGGHYLHATDTKEVPALVSSEVKRMLASTGRRVAEEGGAAPGTGPLPGPAPSGTGPPPAAKDPASPPPEVASPAPRLAVRALEKSALLAPLPEQGPPAVLGVLPVSARPEARVLLVAGDEGRPLLAFKNYGLGRVAAWTADLGGAWSAEWRAAPAFPAWLAQWVNALSPPAVADDAVDVLLERDVQPLGPTPSQRAALERFCGEPLRDWRSVSAPAPTPALTQRSLGVVLALVGALALLVLAFAEFRAARRSA